MLSFKYLYRNLVKLGRPGDRALAEQPQLDSVRRVPVPAAGELAPLTQVRRSLITVYQSGRTGSKLIDHLTRAVYKEWRYRSSEYPDVKAPLQAACAAIAAGVNATTVADMEAVNGLIERVHALLVAIGFLPATAFHLIAVLIVIEANPLAVFSSAAAAAVALPPSFGVRNPMFPANKEMRPYRVDIVDDVYLCRRFLDANDDIRERMQREWNLFRTRSPDFADDLAQRVPAGHPHRAALKAALEAVVVGRELRAFPPSYRPYMIALAMAASDAGRPQAATTTKSAAAGAKAAAAPTVDAAAAAAMAIDGNVAGQRAAAIGGRRKTVDSGKLLAKKQLTRIRSMSGPKLCVQ